ncbi:MAG: hypothetical protein ACI97A_004013 [Planctomycetota bacterium]|jgi:hypothetical protein
MRNDLLADVKLTTSFFAILPRVNWPARSETGVFGATGFPLAQALRLRRGFVLRNQKMSKVILSKSLRRSSWWC